jgi:hypothetical protein
MGAASSLSSVAKETGVDDASPAVSGWLATDRAVESIVFGSLDPDLAREAVRASDGYLVSEWEYFVPESARRDLRRRVREFESLVGASLLESGSKAGLLTALSLEQALGVSSSPSFFADLQRRRALARFALALPRLDPKASGEVRADPSYRPDVLIPGTLVRLAPEVV